MNTLLLIVCSVLLAGIVGALFVPVLRGAYRGPFFFSAGGGRGKDLRLKRRILIENLRDLSIEKESRKMDAAEFERLAGPLARELHGVETRLTRMQPRVTGSGTAGARFCPVCGGPGTLRNPASGPIYCEQCGSEFPELTP